MDHSDWLVFAWEFKLWTITMVTVHFHVFFLSWEIQVERNKKKWNLIFSSQQYNYSKWNLVLHSKFAKQRSILK